MHAVLEEEDDSQKARNDRETLLNILNCDKDGNCLQREDGISEVTDSECDEASSTSWRNDLSD